MKKLSFVAIVLLVLVGFGLMSQFASLPVRATEPEGPEDQPSPEDMIVGLLHGNYARFAVLDSGTILIQIGSWIPAEDPNEPDVFVVDESFGFSPKNNTDSLSLVVHDKYKVLDVDEEYATGLRGTGGISVTRLFGDDNKAIGVFDGNVSLSIETDVIAIKAINHDTDSEFSFVMAKEGLEYEDNTPQGIDEEPCCQTVGCFWGDCVLSSSCNNCSCICFFGAAICGCQDRQFSAFANSPLIPN